MRIFWAARASRDLDRLHEFLAPKSARAAADIARRLILAPNAVVETPRLGQAIESSDNREIRRIFVGDYELRYEVAGDEIRVLRIWHERERR